MKYSINLKYLPVYLLGYLPFWLLYLVSDFMYFIICYLVQYRKKVILDNLKRAFPEKTDAERVQIMKKFYAHFCDLIVEATKILVMSEKTTRKRFKIVNNAEMEAYFAEERDFIMYAAHWANWEWLALIPRFSSYTVATMYQPLTNKYFDGLMNRIRSNFGVVTVESKKGYKKMIEHSRSGIRTLYCIIGDQSPASSPRVTKYWTSFLGSETAFLVGGGRIATKAKMNAVFPTMRKPKRGHYELSFDVLAKAEEKISAEELIDRYVAHLEKTIKERPELWLWSHRRWKLKPPQQ